MFIEFSVCVRCNMSDVHRLRDSFGRWRDSVRRPPRLPSSKLFSPFYSELLNGSKENMLQLPVWLGPTCTASHPISSNFSRAVPGKLWPRGQAIVWMLIKCPDHWASPFETRNAGALEQCSACACSVKFFYLVLVSFFPPSPRPLARPFFAAIISFASFHLVLDK